MKLPATIKRLADILAELPSIGPRQAIRLVFHLIDQGEGNIHELARRLDELKKIKRCERCFFIHQNSGKLCDICSDRTRNQSVILILEKETDLLSLENTGKYHGLYLVLGPIPKNGALEPWQRERLQAIKVYIQKELGGQAEEIILGMNPTSTGDFHAALLGKELQGITKKLSRLGRGLPTGGEIEFADDETLGSALERRS